MAGAHGRPPRSPAGQGGAAGVGPCQLTLRQPTERSVRCAGEVSPYASLW